MKLSEFIKWYRENAEKISKGPWISPTGDYVWSGDDLTKLVCSADEEDCSYEQRFDNMHFVANSRNTMPDIVAALEEAKKIISSHDVKCEHPDARDWCEKYFPSEES